MALGELFDLIRSVSPRASSAASKHRHAGMWRTAFLAHSALALAALLAGPVRAYVIGAPDEQREVQADVVAVSCEYGEAPKRPADEVPPLRFNVSTLGLWPGDIAPGMTVFSTLYARERQLGRSWDWTAKYVFDPANPNGYDTVMAFSIRDGPGMSEGVGRAVQDAVGKVVTIECVRR
ncbi:MAG: hypothetical protein M1832_002523 [Thelocarpon impressellum]|nr:MAG: hypothetical protein M1832_002523 [Thelocarpon impressellum]